MGRLPTAVEKATYDQEVQRAAQEGRDPEYANLGELVEANIAEEDLVWGSQSMKDQGRAGRHASHGTNPDHDEEHGVKTTGAASTTYVETVPDDSEHIKAQAEAAQRDKESGVVDPEVYDPNAKLGAAIAAGVAAGTASKGEPAEAAGEASDALGDALNGSSSDEEDDE